MEDGEIKDQQDRHHGGEGSPVNHPDRTIGRSHGGRVGHGEEGRQAAAEMCQGGGESGGHGEHKILSKGMGQAGAAQRKS